MSDCPCTFPESVSFSCAIELAKQVKAGTLLSNRASAIKHAACLLGSIGNQLADNNQPDPVFASPERSRVEQMSEQELVEYVCENCPEEQEGPQPVSMNPLVLIAIQKLLEMAVRRLLS